MMSSACASIMVRRVDAASVYTDFPSWRARRDAPLRITHDPFICFRVRRALGADGEEVRCWRDAEERACLVRLRAVKEGEKAADARRARLPRDDTRLRERPHSFA